MNRSETISKINTLMQYWPLQKPAYIDHCNLNFRTSKDEKLLVRIILNKTFPKDDVGLARMRAAAADAFDYMKKAFKELTNEKLDAKKVNEEAVLNPRNVNGDLDAIYFVDVEITISEEKEVK